MQQVRRVHILQTLEHLVDDVLLMDILENICSDDCVEVSIHEVEYQVDIPVILSSDDILEANNIFVTNKLLEENNLPKGSLGISSILEGVKVFLQCDDLLGTFIDCFPDDTVSALS